MLIYVHNPYSFFHLCNPGSLRGPELISVKIQRPVQGEPILVKLESPIDLNARMYLVCGRRPEYLRVSGDNPHRHETTERPEPGFKQTTEELQTFGCCLK